jgi:hypothetical protein
VAYRGPKHVRKRTEILFGLNHTDLRFIGLEGKWAEYVITKHPRHLAPYSRPLLLRRLCGHGKLPNSGMSRLEPKCNNAISLLRLHSRYGLPLLVRLWFQPIKQFWELAGFRRVVPKTDDEPNPISKIHQLLCWTKPHQRNVGQLLAWHHRNSLDPDCSFWDEKDRPGQMEEKIIE